MKWSRAGGARKSFSQRAIRKNSAAEAVKEPSTTSTESESPSQLVPLTSLRVGSILPGKSYELTVRQFQHMSTAARMGNMLMMVPSPKFLDEPQRAREYNALCDEY